MEVVFHLDGRTISGGSALVVHNERLADPLDPWTKAVAEISARRKKTEADHLEMARLEWHGGLYTADNQLDGRPIMPSWNILRTLQNGAKRYKRGVDVLRGVYPKCEECPIIYDGPIVPDEMWLSGRFSLRKGVGIQGKRVIRTRPIFTDWQISMPATIDPEVWNLADVQMCWKSAGQMVGLCEMRPVYGRFVGTVDLDTGKAKRGRRAA